ncbi:MAG TPA: hypothetical protein ENI27_05930 [bacterium]|nr:hypothetical protein [bacterium]
MKNITILDRFRGDGDAPSKKRQADGSGTLNKSVLLLLKKVIMKMDDLIAKMDKKKRKWTFKVIRDEDGLITKIEAFEDKQ